uniref:Uncharacterized protein n=1 Tax=Pyxicephalus adspersus TaxID=30357 RepID=A0AAV3A1T9_PYXAD|nr:TPA: hypothetical protein GDO54_017290 [Pyxicephalus adspersus]
MLVFSHSSSENSIPRSNSYCKRKRSAGVSKELKVDCVSVYLETYLNDFLVSANRYFMPNLSCVFYILTDRPDQVLDIEFRPGVSKVILQIPMRSRWQDISMLRMKDFLDFVLPRATEQVDYLFCMDVDQIFTSNYGPEVLGKLVAQLHSGFYQSKRKHFTYEDDPRSAAYIPPGEGDFYYHAAVFGGTPSNLISLTSSCLKGILKDKKQNVEAVWHDESHLNRYFALEMRPVKILSPEYCWDNRLRWWATQTIFPSASRSLSEDRWNFRSHSTTNQTPMMGFATPQLQHCIPIWHNNQSNFAFR